MIIPFFKTLHKMLAHSLAIILCLSVPSLHALSPEQELKICKPALLAQLNEQKRVKVKGCPISEKLILWMGILRKPEQFTARELMTFVEAHPHWPHYDKLCQKTEDVINTKGSPKEVLAWFAKHPPKTPEGVIVYAKALLPSQPSQAKKVVTTAWETMEMETAQEKKFLSHFAKHLSEKNHRARLHFLLWEENEEGAKRLLCHVPAKVRKAAELRLALLEGRALQNTSLPQEEGICYEAVKCHKKNKNWGEAAKLLLHTPPSKLYAEKWWKLRNYVAREFIALKDFKTAYHILKKHNLEPGAENFADAEWHLGWLALRFLDRPLEGQRHFETFSKNVKTAISKARAAYWLGRTHEKKGERTLAEKWYRKSAQYKTTYYGQLGALKLREKPYPTLSAAPKVTAEEKKRFHQKDLVQAAYILKGLGKGAAHELCKFLSPIASQAKTKAERELAVHLAHTLSPCDVVWVAKRAFA